MAIFEKIVIFSILAKFVLFQNIVQHVIRLEKGLHRFLKDHGIYSESIKRKFWTTFLQPFFEKITRLTLAILAKIVLFQNVIQHLI